MIEIDSSAFERARVAYLKREYTFAWIAVVSAWVLGLFFWIPLVIECAFYAGWALEAVALHRKKIGDTFSEHLVKFRDGKWGRDILIGGICVGLSWSFVQVGRGPMPVRIILALTFLAWFPVHIYTDLKEA